MSDLQRTIYDRQYAATAPSVRLTHQDEIFLDWLARHAPETSRLDLLDLGGGDASFGFKLRARNLPRAIAYVNCEMSAAGALRGKEGGFATVRGKIPENGHLPFKDGSFDVVHCSQVIEHVVNPDAIFEEARRILRPGGILFVTTPNMASWIGRLMVLCGWQGYGQEVSTRFPLAGKGPLGRYIFGSGGVNFHLRLFTAAGLRDLTRCHGFAIDRFVGARTMEKSGFGNPRAAIMAAAYWGDLVLHRCPSLANNILCFARKPVDTTTA